MTLIEDIDPWTELEHAGAVPPPSEEVLLAVRTAVRRAATTTTLRTDVIRIRRRRRWRAGLAVAGLTAALAVGSALVDVGDHPIALRPAAAAVLERAAEATLTESDPVVGPGQYLRITLVEQHWTTSYDDDNDREVRIGSDGKPVAWQFRWTRQIWVPHDVHADWTFRERGHTMTTMSKDAAAGAKSDNVPMSIWRQPSWADKSGQTYLDTYDPGWYASLPRDPDALLARLKAEDTSEGTGIAYKMREVYSEVLRSGIAPAEIRAALFTALAKQPGIQVVNGVTTLDGHDGIGIGTDTWQMVFDRETGRYVGERAVDSKVPGHPGEPNFLSSVRTEVVDSAPKPNGRQP